MTQYKLCRGCNESKELIAFTRCSSGKYGVMGQCKLCNKKKRAVWLANHPDYNKTYYANNQEILLHKKREKRKTDEQKEKDKIIRAKWRAAMGEEVYSEWRKRTKDRIKISEYNKKYSERLPDAAILSRINRTSKTRFTLENVPPALIESYRLLTLIRREINEDRNRTT